MPGARVTANVHLSNAEPNEIRGQILDPASPRRFISVHLGGVAVFVHDAEQAREIAALFTRMADELDAKNALAVTLGFPYAG